jgi:5,10-methylenetetrahydrofolate reductase
LKVSEIVRAGNFATLVELFPPGLPSPGSMKDSQKFDLEARFERLVQSIQELEALADAFSLPELKDTQRIHFNSVAIASELKRRTNSDVIPTITLRDSNRQNLLGAISFAIFAGLENLQIVRGDPYHSQSEPSNVYDISKVSSLVSLVRKLEAHLLNTEKVCILGQINLTRISDERYVATALQREASGIDIFVTESLFEEIEAYLDRVVKVRGFGIKSPIVHNIFAFRDYDDALACVQKFGWRVSSEELHALKTVGPKYGIDKARERYQDLLDRKEIVQGVCISTRGNPELVRQITS